MKRPKAAWFGQPVQELRVYDAEKNPINVDGYKLRWGVPLNWPLDGETFFAPDGRMLFETGVGYLVSGFEEDSEAQREETHQVKKKRKLDDSIKGQGDPSKKQKFTLHGPRRSVQQRREAAARDIARLEQKMQKEREVKERAAQIADLEEQLLQGQAYGGLFDMAKEAITRYERNSAENEEVLKRSRRLDILPMSLDEALETTRILQEVRGIENED